MTRYQVRSRRHHVDEEFANKDSAKALAETLQDAELTTWNVHRNLPGALPKNVYKSCALENWNGTDWKRVNIHCG